METIPYRRDGQGWLSQPRRPLDYGEARIFKHAYFRKSRGEYLKEKIMKMKKVFAIFVITVSLLAVLSCSGNKKPQLIKLENHIPTGAGLEFVSAMKIGWNLGNTLDAHFSGTPNETGWGNPRTTQELMDTVAALGFGAVRIPVTWIKNIGPAPDYIIKESWLNRVAEVVEYAHRAGLKSIINIHHDGADSEYWLSVKVTDISGTNKEEIDNQFIAVWSQIAEKFKDTGDYLLFEAFNELHDGSWGNGIAPQHARINELNQIFVDTIRSSSGINKERYLVIPGWVTRPSVTVSSLVMPSDTVPERLIVTFHYYDPYDFTGSARQTVWGDNALPGNWANETHVRRTFDSVKERFIDNKIPVIIGEYGAVNQATEEGKAYRRYYMEYVTKYAADCGFVPFYWDNGGYGAGSEKFGLIDREEPIELMPGAEPIIEVMMKAVNEDYPLSSITPP
jgi:endoglucanase